MDKEGLEILVLSDRLRMDAGDLSGKIIVMNLLAAERLKRDIEIRTGYKEIFAATGMPTDQQDNVTTPRFAVMHGNDQHSRLYATVTANLLPGTTGDIVVDFYEGTTHRGENRYSPNPAVRVLARGQDYTSWALGQWETSNPPYEGIAHEMQQADQALDDAQETIAMLWEALSDPELNPMYAQNIAAMQQA